MCHAPMVGVYPASGVCLGEDAQSLQSRLLRINESPICLLKNLDIKVDGEGLGSAISVHGVSNSHARPSGASSD